jgi:hypothetical protein
MRGASAAQRKRDEKISEKAKDPGFTLNPGIFLKRST